MREKGFYWIIINDGNERGWEVAEYIDENGWMILGVLDTYEDSDFTEIDETKIERK